jgi:PAS domain-containing protein
MPKLNLSQNTFTAGELSPRLLGRSDADFYGQGLKRARNAHPVIHGGIKARAGFRYITTAQSNTDNASVIVPFIEGQGSAWMIEFGNLVLRVCDTNGAVYGPITSPYTSAQLAQIDWAQSDSTLWIFHPDVMPQRLQRFGDVWVIGAAPFTQIPFSEVGFVGSVQLTLSLGTVGTGRTATAASAMFLASDVGRGIIAAAGVGVITGYTSTTVVTIDITRAFAGTTILAGAWEVEGSPQTTCTPSAKDPVGATITLTLGAAGWRANNVGAIVRINGGLCRITGYTSDTIVNAVILRELTATVAAPALAWSLEPIIWSANYGYPRTGTAFQQRLIAAGSRKFPRTVWGSRIGEQLDFERWTNDDDSFAFTIDSDESTPIRFVSSTKQLAVFTQSAEYSLRSGVEKPITPTNVRCVPESNHGCAAVRPVQIGDEQVFVQRSGRKVRSFGYRYDFDAYRSPDIAARAEHITKPSIIGLTYMQELEQMLWGVRSDGQFVSCTIDRDQQPAVIGWALHETQGFIECMQTIPGDGRDQVWAIVRRTYNGTTQRTLEHMDDTLEPLHPDAPTPDGIDRPVYGCTLDSANVWDDAAGTTSIPALHLVGNTVSILADGSVLPDQVVGPLGYIELPRAAKRTIVGLSFRAEVCMLTPDAGGPSGSVKGQQARTGRVLLQFLDTVGCKIQNNDGLEEIIPFRRFGPGILNQMPIPFTGYHEVTKLGWAKGLSEITVIQDQPLPLHLLSIAREHSANG